MSEKELESVKELEAEAKHHSPLLIWGIMVTFFIYQFVARSAFPTVLTEEYMKYFCLDAKGVGTLVSCYYIIYTLLQIPAGIIIDRVSMKIVAPIAVLICATGVGIFISSQNVTIASIGQMMVGFGSAFSFLIVLKTCLDFFPPEKRALMLTYAASVGSLAPVIFGPLIAVIVKTFEWRHVMFIYAISGYILAGIMWNLIDDNMKGNENNEESTESKKLSILQSLKIVISSPQCWILALFAGMQYAPLSALADLWGTSYIKKLYDADTAVASLANNMIYLGIVIGGPLSSYLAVFLDSYKKVLLIASVSCAAVFAAILFSGNCVPLCGMFVLLFLVGICTSACMHFPLGAALMPKEVGGTVSGFLNMGSMLSGVILQPLIGALLNISWNGTTENGIPIYSLEDFQFGLSPVFAFLLAAIIFAIFSQDKSPKAE